MSGVLSVPGISLLIKDTTASVFIDTPEGSKIGDTLFLMLLTESAGGIVTPPGFNVVRLENDVVAGVDVNNGSSVGTDAAFGLYTRSHDGSVNYEIDDPDESSVILVSIPGSVSIVNGTTLYQNPSSSTTETFNKLTTETTLALVGVDSTFGDPGLSLTASQDALIDTTGSNGRSAGGLVYSEGTSVDVTTAVAASSNAYMVEFRV